MTEVIVYHVFNARESQSSTLPAMSSVSALPASAVKREDGLFSSFLLKSAKILALLGILLITFSYGPSIWYYAKGLIGIQDSNFSLSNSEITHLTIAKQVAKQSYTPPFDPKLPVINHLYIPSIGVDTPIQEATYDNYESALKKGVWRVSDFGSPDESGAPVILAAHRFGYLAWSNLYRHLNSFYNLPSVKVGDTIQIVWRQRKYTYEVYSVQSGTEITDYTADLILYTCVSLTGSTRDFVYARLLPL